MLTALVAVSCSGEGTPDEAAAPDRTPAAGPGTASPTPEPSPEATEVEIWLVTEGGLQVTHHDVAAVEGIGAETMRDLLAGPAEAEAELGMGTAIPDGTELLGLDIDGGVATVDLSGSFDDGGGSASMQARVAQVVYTLTQFPTVDEVVFHMDGEPVEALGGEGLVLDRPQRRKDHQDQLAPIVVATPRIGSEHSGSIEVTGTANVFEATVSLRVVAADGTVLQETFTTATCGTGCRGDYTATVEVDVDVATEATLEVFESSAEDGSALHLVAVPIILQP